MNNLNKLSNMLKTIHRLFSQNKPTLFQEGIGVNVVRKVLNHKYTNFTLNYIKAHRRIFQNEE